MSTQASCTVVKTVDPWLGGCSDGLPRQLVRVVHARCCVAAAPPTCSSAPAAVPSVSSSSRRFAPCRLFCLHVAEDGDQRCSATTSRHRSHSSPRWSCARQLLSSVSVGGTLGCRWPESCAALESCRRGSRRHGSQRCCSHRPGGGQRNQQHCCEQGFPLGSLPPSPWPCTARPSAPPRSRSSREPQRVEARRRGREVAPALGTGHGLEHDALLLPAVTHERREAAGRDTGRTGAEEQQRGPQRRLHLADHGPKPPDSLRRGVEVSGLWSTGCLLASSRKWTLCGRVWACLSTRLCGPH